MQEPIDRVINFSIKMADRMERFTSQDQMQFSHAMINCNCLCARLMKELLAPELVQDALQKGMIQIKKVK
jgi:hypothetical protein